MDNPTTKKRKITSFEASPDVLELLEEMERSEVMGKGALINEALRRHGLQIVQERVKKMADSVSKFSGAKAASEQQDDAADAVKARGKRKP